MWVDVSHQLIVAAVCGLVVTLVVRTGGRGADWLSGPSYHVAW